MIVQAQHIVLSVFLCYVFFLAVPAAAQEYPQGIFVGVEELKEASQPDADGFVWYRENTLTIRGDSVFLKKSLVCYRDDKKYQVASSPTTIITCEGRIDGSGSIFLRTVQCGTCQVELRQNPETGVYEEVKNRGETATIRFEGDMVHLDGVVYMKRG